MTKRVKYSAIWKESIKIVKESKLSFFTTFPSSIFYSLLHNFIIFPQFFIPSFTILIFSLNYIILPPAPHLLYIFSIHDHIDPTSTQHRPHIDPTLRIKIVKLYTTTFLLFPSSTTANTFLLFFLHHHYLPSTVASLWPPSSHCYCFSTTWFWHEFGLFGLSGRKTIGGVKTIEMWWWWRRKNNTNVVVVEGNNRNVVVVVVVVEGKQ